MISRRHWLSSVAVATPLSFVPMSLSFAAQESPVVTDSFPSTNPQLASEIVGASHVKLDRVKELLNENPSLARASWDWGFGDWETAIGAASHTGRRDIIEVLLAHGASPTIFTFAALDHVDAVRAICQAHPNIQIKHGPHGITLYKHAVAGNSDRVIEYLKELGNSDIPQTNSPLSADQMSVYIGNYDFGNGPQDALEVGTGSSTPKLGLRRMGSSSFRFMAHLGDHTFTVFGSPQVNIAFDVADNRATTVRIKDGKIDVVAKRI